MVIDYRAVRVGAGEGRAPLVTLAHSEARLAECFRLCNASPDLKVLHLLGHAWIHAGRLFTSIEGRDLALVELLVQLIEDKQATWLLLIDVCHAGALAQELAELSLRNAVVLMACAAEERTEEYALERSTRLTLNLAGILSIKGQIDAHALIGQFRKAPADAIEARLHPQIWSIGSGFDLGRQGVEIVTGKNSTATLLKTLFATAGAAALLAVSIGLNWWWETTWVQLDLSELTQFGGNWSYELSRWEIEENAQQIVQRGTLPGTRLRLDLAPGSYSVRITAEYGDQKPRTLVWPLLLHGAFAPGSKSIALTPPSLTALKRAREMAWISTHAKQVPLGRDGELIETPPPFWIDVFPVRARQIWGSAADSQLRATDSVENALDQVTAGNLPELVDDMKDIMAHLEAETENQRGIDPEQFPSVMLRSTKTPCDDCPAPISKDDAVDWCAKRGGRLPTPEEWQLAARGLDGRLYPWGNRFERAFANIVGLPNKGEVMALTPVDRFPKGVSPFGVWDSVGNSGEWVDDGDLTGSMQAGGGYWNDRDGATVYAIDPVSDAWPYEIGVRCVMEEVP